MKTLGKITIGAAMACILSPAFSAPAAAQDAMLGEVREFGFTFCPRGWAEANGALLPISSNTALFSLLGTQYGGDGRTTFALPDLRADSTPGPTNRAPSPAGEVRIYQHCDYTGWSQAFTPGDYTADDFNARSAFKSDDASSVRVIGNVEVTLFDNGNLGGRQVVLDKDEPCLVNRNLNDAVSSLSVRSVPGRAAAVPARSDRSKLKVCIATQGIFPSRN